MIICILIGLLVSVVIGCEFDPTTADIHEEWGYIDVRPLAHQFWWYMRSPCDKDENKPIIIWLQGGPGGSGTGYGNFMEIGPLDNNKIPRNHTWLKEASLIFIDSPVGAGFSYVDDESAFTTTVYEVADDLVTTIGEVAKLLKSKVYNGKVPKFFIFSESYGGKVAPVFGNKIMEAKEGGMLDDVELGGVVIGDGAVSLLDSGYSYPEYVYQTSQVDYSQYVVLKKIASDMDLAYQQGEFDVASYHLVILMTVIDNITDNMFQYNIRYHHQPPPSLNSSSSHVFNFDVLKNVYDNLTPENKAVLGRTVQGPFHGLTIDYNGDNVKVLMNGEMREKFGIIPDNLKWGEQALACHAHLSDEMIIDVISSVDACMEKGVNVTLYNGMLDFIVNSPGQERWIRKLSWIGLKNYFNAQRIPLYPTSRTKEQATTAFYKAYQNFEFYWILMAGHMVPIDQPEMARDMVRRIINK